MESQPIFFTKCQKCGEIIGVEICRSCLDRLFEKGINLQGEHSEDERNRVAELNISLLCENCRFIVNNTLCEECNEMPDPFIVLKKKGKKLAKNFTLGYFEPPTQAKIIYFHYPEIDIIIDSIADRIIMDLPGLVFSNRESPSTQGGLFIPIRDDFGDITAQGAYLSAPSKAIINRMNDVAQAIWELIRKGDLINPKDDVTTFEHELNKLVKRMFTK